MINPVGRRVIYYRSLTVMQYRNNTSRFCRALTLVETVLAMAIMAIILAAMLPQFRVIQNSWDSKAGAFETMQNGRVLIDHIHRNLSTATKVTAVSGPSDTNGYIEFMDNASNTLRYDVSGTSNYVEFGSVGDLYDLAGPVSQSLFTCHDGNDFDTAITDVNNIRFIKVQTILTNPSKMSQDKTFSTSVYLRASGCNYSEGITKFTPFEYDTAAGMAPALAKIDTTHYLCIYQGDMSDGWAVVLTVDTQTGQITKETPFEFDTVMGMTPALAPLDPNNYLCTYTGELNDGWAVMLTVNTGTWEIAKGIPFEFDTDNGMTPALAQIDTDDYLCVYHGSDSDGWAVILKPGYGPPLMP